MGSVKVISPRWTDPVIKLIFWQVSDPFLHLEVEEVVVGNMSGKVISRMQAGTQ